jgi:signal transduction histidine kinase
VNLATATWEPDERESLRIAALPWVMLALCAAVTPLAGAGGETPALVLSGVTAAWMLLARRLRAAYFWGLAALAAALVLCAPWFGFFAFTMYFAVERLPERLRTVGVIAIAVIVGTSQSGARPDGTAGWWAIWALIVTVNVTVALTLMRMNWRADAETERLTVLNRRLEESLAENAALAHQAGVREERERMAGEIHDTLAQGLAGIITQLQAAENAGPDAGRHLEAAKALARESLTEARRSVQALRPEVLEAAQLPDALAGVAAGWSDLHGVPAEVTVTGAARPMRPEVEVTLLRTAQEALANVAKHAQASRVGLTLSYMEDVVTLDVRDDGVGFDTAANGGSDGGYGLMAMRQRVLGLEGMLALESEPGGGTALSASVPAMAPGGER